MPDYGGKRTGAGRKRKPISDTDLIRIVQTSGQSGLSRSQRTMPIVRAWVMLTPSKGSLSKPRPASFWEMIEKATRKRGRKFIGAHTTNPDARRLVEAMRQIEAKRPGTVSDLGVRGFAETVSDRMIRLGRYPAEHHDAAVKAAVRLWSRLEVERAFEIATDEV